MTSNILERTCVVCGAKSHRVNWVHEKIVKDTKYVACDKHSAAEFDKAVAGAEAIKAKAAIATAKAAPAKPVVPPTAKPVTPVVPPAPPVTPAPPTPPKV